jgi:hypothetical protein
MLVVEMDEQVQMVMEGFVDVRMQVFVEEVEVGWSVGLGSCLDRSWWCLESSRNQMLKEQD